MFSLTAAAIGYLVYRSADQLADKQVDLSKIDYRWWLGAVMVYLVSMLLSAVFWQRVLFAFGQHPKFADSVAAFFTSQLGKYVPGKAMVVVIRTDMIRGENVRTKPAAASVFVETLSWLFTGAAIASMLMIVRFHEYRVFYWLTLACVSLATVAGFVSLLPGGIGVRELVMIPLLGPTIGSANAIIAAIVIRLVWLASELVGAGVFSAVRFLANGKKRIANNDNSKGK